MDEAVEALDEIGLPCIIRSFFSLGGSRGGIAYSEAEFYDLCNQNFTSYTDQKIIIDKSLIGWKEFELEVVRDLSDNCIVVCTIENVTPAGVHTGDSITVAPAQTLTDKEYQLMRDAAFKIIREIGINTGGANVQFVIDPKTGEMLVIEINPRVSRSSALASKATGFPIAKVAAKLAVGYTLDELRNQITKSVIPCSFEPTIDYVVTKIPRFNFDKFPNSVSTLDVQMRSVGEAMAIGRNFQESLQKAFQSLDVGYKGLSMLGTNNTHDNTNLDDVLVSLHC
jgi:carbamoyl-phosphate synthase large subunit